MSTLEKNLYKRVSVKENQTAKQPPASKAYRGISTVDTSNGFTVYDIALIKQDIINHFHIRQGEKLENPEFGTIIWDVLYEPMTEQLKTAIANNVTEIVNYDPRVQVENVTVDSYETGIQIELDLSYLPYNISESMRLSFDENNGLI
jgi:phage baseplate assembly protein W